MPPDRPQRGRNPSTSVRGTGAVAPWSHLPAHSTEQRSVEVARYDAAPAAITLARVFKRRPTERKLIAAPFAPIAFSPRAPQLARFVARLAPVLRAKLRSRPTL